jgi:hypothetical protein
LPDVKREDALVKLHRAYTLALAAGAAAVDLRAIFLPKPQLGVDHLEAAVRGWMEADIALRAKLNPHGARADLPDSTVKAATQTLRQWAREGQP